MTEAMHTTLFCLDASTGQFAVENMCNAADNRICTRAYKYGNLTLEVWGQMFDVDFVCINDPSANGL